MILTRDCLQTLTGKKQGQAQAEWLTRNKIPYRIGGAGLPVVLMNDVTAWAGGNSLTTRRDAIMGYAPTQTQQGFTAARLS